MCIIMPFLIGFRIPTGMRGFPLLPGFFPCYTAIMRNIWLVCLALALVSCGVRPATPFPSETPTVTSIPSETPVWFPPTFTHAPVPTADYTPTPDVHQQLGSLILRDDFDSGKEWPQAATVNSSITVANQHLTLVLSKQGGYLFSLRKSPYVKDFYLEITAETNLCRGQDEYGILVRAASNSSYYRFGLACDGTARVERLLRGILSLSIPPQVNGAVPVGSPSASRLAIWAQGRQIRFYANEQMLFSLNDSSLSAGSIGVFIRAQGDSVLSVNFSQLEIYEIGPQ
jgi:hypothetical protein